MKTISEMIESGAQKLHEKEENEERQAMEETHQRLAGWESFLNQVRLLLPEAVHNYVSSDDLLDGRNAPGQTGTTREIELRLPDLAPITIRISIREAGPQLGTDQPYWAAKYHIPQRTRNDQRFVIEPNLFRQRGFDDLEEAMAFARDAEEGKASLEREVAKRNAKHEKKEALRAELAKAPLSDNERIGEMVVDVVDQILDMKGVSYENV